MNSLQRHIPGMGSALSWREDLALAVTVDTIQVAGTYLTAGHLDHEPGHLASLRWTLDRQGTLTPAEWVLAVAGPLVLVLRRRHPVAVLWMVFAVAVIPFSPWLSYLSVVVAFLHAAASGHRKTALAVITLAYPAVLWLPMLTGAATPSLESVLFLAAWTALLVTAAEILRMRRERAAQARTGRLLDERRHASEERLRMARELHDVIGHNISLMNIQAGVGLDLMDTRPEQARTALTAIKTVSKEALDELRTLLATLRQDDEQPDRSPAAGLDRLPDLLSLTDAAGLAVTTEITGTPVPLPAGVDLAAYRIVQESVTNIIRHAHARTVTIHLTYNPEDLRMEINDDGHGPSRTARDPGTGTGIPGMRERALAFGGHLTAGPLPVGGFRVLASLPLRSTR